MPERRNRLGIYLFGGLCLVACLLYLVLADGPRILIGIFVAAAAMNGIALVINLWSFALDRKCEYNREYSALSDSDFDGGLVLHSCLSTQQHTGL